MIEDLWLVGIGTGSEAHLTLEGRKALQDAAVVLLPRKGRAKDELADIRLRILEQVGSTAQVIEFDYPTRDPDLPYQARVMAWHDEIALRWQAAISGAKKSGPVALLVWGDPSLYDSTLRIADRLDPKPRMRVVPGITAIQALTAAHAIPLNDVGAPVLVTTGRRLRDEGWPDGVDTLVVMLDGELSFRLLSVEGIHIWWGAYLGAPEQILCAGPLAEVLDTIVDMRQRARAQYGWIMDTYLMRRTVSST